MHTRFSLALLLLAACLFSGCAHNSKIYKPNIDLGGNITPGHAVEILNTLSLKHHWVSSEASNLHADDSGIDLRKLIFLWDVRDPQYVQIPYRCLAITVNVSKDESVYFIIPFLKRPDCSDSTLLPNYITFTDINKLHSAINAFLAMGVELR